MSQDVAARTVWIATQHIRDYANPAEPKLYPYQFTEFIEKSAYDKKVEMYCTERDRANRLQAELTRTYELLHKERDERRT